VPNSAPVRRHIAPTLHRAARAIAGFFRARWRAMLVALEHEERFILRSVTGVPKSRQGECRYCPLCNRVHLP